MAAQSICVGHLAADGTRFPDSFKNNQEQQFFLLALHFTDMKATLFASAFVRFFALLFALHLLNFSIDSRDSHPDFVPEDFLYNDVESIVEFVAEIVLGIDDAIFEYDEADEELGGEGVFFNFFCSPAWEHLNLPFYSYRVVNHTLLRKVCYISNIPDIKLLPPKSMLMSFPKLVRQA